MRHVNYNFKDMLASVPPQISMEVDMEMAVSDRIADLMERRGLSKMQLAQALGKRPSEITKWLSGQHNFTIKTLSMLSVFFGESLIYINNNTSRQMSIQANG